MKTFILLVVGCIVKTSSGCAAAELCVQNLERKYNVTINMNSIEEASKFCVDISGDTCWSEPEVSSCGLTGSEDVYYHYITIQRRIKKYCSENVCSELNIIKECWDQLDYTGIPNSEYGRFCGSVERCRDIPITDSVCNSTKAVLESKITGDPQRIVQYICDANCVNVTETITAIRSCVGVLSSDDQTCGAYNSFFGCLNEYSVCPEVVKMVEYFHEGFGDLLRRCRLIAKPSVTTGKTVTSDDGFISGGKQGTDWITGGWITTHYTDTQSSTDATSELPTHTTDTPVPKDKTITKPVTHVWRTTSSENQDTKSKITSKTTSGSFETTSGSLASDDETETISTTAAWMSSSVVKDTKTSKLVTPASGSFETTSARGSLASDSETKTVSTTVAWMSSSVIKDTKTSKLVTKGATSEHMTKSTMVHKNSGTTIRGLVTSTQDVAITTSKGSQKDPIAVSTKSVDGARKDEQLSGNNGCSPMVTFSLVILQTLISLTLISLIT